MVLYWSNISFFNNSILDDIECVIGLAYFYYFDIFLHYFVWIIVDSEGMFLFVFCFWSFIIYIQLGLSFVDFILLSRQQSWKNKVYRNMSDI